MRHSEPRIQELAEVVQGALSIISDRRVVWYAEPAGYGGWNVRFVVLPSSPDRPNAYSAGFAIGPRQLNDVIWWEDLKRAVVRQVLVKLADDAKPAKEQDVIWHAAPWIEPRSNRAQCPTIAAVISTSTTPITVNDDPNVKETK